MPAIDELRPEDQPALYFRCESCEPAPKWKLREGNLRLIGTMEVCEYCFFTKWDECQGCHIVSQIVADSSGRPYCEPCRLDRSFTCGYCENIEDTDNLWQRTEERGPVCRNCRADYQEEYGTEEEPIHGYTYKPKAKFHGTSRDGLYFGVELEIDTDRDASGPSRGSTRHRELGDQKLKPDAAQLRKDTGGKQSFLYIKSDGTVPCGFEIVTYPLSWGWLQANGAKLDPIFAMVKKGYVSHDSGRCGMHVHMSKSAFGHLQLYKFLSFFRKNEDFILTVSQRGDKEKLNRYSKVSYTGQGADATYQDRKLKKFARDKQQDTDRYQAVNMLNDGTIEIRIFRGTLKKERFLKNLEFCMAMYDFTKAVSVAQCTLQNFLGFVALSKGSYPNLYQFLTERYDFVLLRRKPKKGAKKAHSRFGLRFSGAKAAPEDADFSDTLWDGIVAGRNAARQDKINQQIAKAKQAKALAA